jgi:FKBP-type peptidyl-prolyl cis-trans isomerase
MRSRLRQAGFWPLVIVLLSPCIGRAQEAHTAPASPGTSLGSASPSLDGFAAVGSDLANANRLSDMGWTEAQIEAFIRGIRSAVQGKPVPYNDDARQITESINKRLADFDLSRRQEEFARPGRLKQYLKEMCKRLDLEQSDSGLCFKVIPGPVGARPGPDDTVLLSCAAFQADVTTPIPELTNENARGKISDMLPGFVEGIQMMTEEGAAVFILPPSLSFGTGKWPEGVAPGTPLIFRVRLNKIVRSSTGAASP